MPADTAHPPRPATWAGVPDAVLVDGLCRRDERGRRDEGAYLELVRRHTPLMLRLARGVVGGTATAEDVVQDTWIAVLRSIERFERRSSVKTWLMRILLNTARTRRLQESRTVARSTLAGDAPFWDAVVPVRADPRAPEPHVLGGETWARIRAALDLLPERQRTVVVLRDVEGWSSEEVQEALALSPGNQRVLLHRGRSRLRELLHDLAPGAVPAAEPGCSAG